jgi:pyruvate dehydrogenase E2 component (dihydrolipoamide acetyltransferase)
MATVVIMPKQGLQMTEGKITQWLVEEGGRVAAGEPLFEMETDKLSITIDAPADGVLLKILHEAGDEVPITVPIAIIGEPGEDISALLGTISDISPVPEPDLDEVKGDKPEHVEVGNAAGEGPKVFASPRARMAAEQKGIDISQISGSGPEGLVIERDVLALASAEQSKAAPLARKSALVEGEDLKAAAGTKPHEKIEAADVPAPIAAGAQDSARSVARGEKLLTFTGMRKTIAARMKESLLEMAQANHRITVDMTEAVKLREQLKAVGIKVSYNDIVMRCTAKALTEYPILNSSWSEKGILLKEYVNIGMAVAVESGLIVPVIKDIDLMTLPEIAARSRELAEKAREGKLLPEEYTGGTFTVSNLGMFDIDSFTAIINPPEAAILAVGRLVRQPVVTGDEISIRPVMQLSLTYDHRIVDGAPAAQFLHRIKMLLETPGILI